MFQFKKSLKPRKFSEVKKELSIFKMESAFKKKSILGLILWNIFVHGGRHHITGRIAL